ncbi:hypothetical protein ACFQ3P_42395 [Paraburkholderia sabiae]|uniref:Uncharacterized protein n=1 Tax=Paraburkholderia sabiae TaxID=273251 RepID=A0ABU9QSN4_9BURK|nr:hypothetical protein [Paraburkholderia sabiae]WJZ79593.1 hypothetical protein QEN71_40650 [Paraburkholderia sabiae]
MRKEDIRTIVEAACETADSIVGARAWKTEEDASAMHDVIFWEVLAKQLPDYSVAEVLALFDEQGQSKGNRTA